MRPGSKIRFRVLILLLPLGLLVGMAALSLGFVSSAAAAPPLAQGWTQVVKGGFTDPNNFFLSSWARFKDFLYVSTYALESGFAFSGSHKAGSDIWRTQDGITWEQIGTAGLGDTNNVAFDLIVFHDRLYAISRNAGGKGPQILVSSDGTAFTPVETGDLGKKRNANATSFVFADRLVLGVSNVQDGAEIWVSDDGTDFRQVVAGGLGSKTATGFVLLSREGVPDSVLGGMLYIGVANTGSGGEIWRTADGLEWERVADRGLGRTASVIIYPEIVYRGQLYAFGGTGGSLDTIAGVDLFRTSDGTTWEQVVDDGFSVGAERNIIGNLAEFDGRLYLTTSNMDVRMLNPANPSERHPLQGFQLRVSDDGKTWTQVGADGFGSETSFFAAMESIGGTAWLTVFDYHAGSQLWRSADGQNWDLVLREPDPDYFQQGSSPLEFKGHFLWTRNDLRGGVAIWRSDQALVAEATPPEAETTPSPAAGFVSSVPLPTEISRDPGVIGTNVALALAFAVIFGLTSSLFNTTLKANYSEIARALAPVGRRVSGIRRSSARLVGPPASRAPAGGRRWLAPVVIIVIAGLVYSLLDPGFGFSTYGLTLFVSLAATIAIVTYAYDGLQAITSTRRYRTPAALKLFPLAIAIAIVCVLVSRLTGFRPGFVYGFVGGMAFLGARQLDDRRKARLVLLAGGCLLAVSLAAWFLAVPVTHAVASGSSWLKVVQGICVGTFVAGLEGLFFGMIPVSITDGGTLFRWNKPAWAAAFGLAAFLFWHVLLNKNGQYGAAFTQSSVKVAVALVAFWTLASVGVYAYFHFRRRTSRPSAAGLQEAVTAGGAAAAGRTGPTPAFCSECGAPLTTGAKYCRGCGSRL